MPTIYDLQENIKAFNIEVVAKQSIAATSNIMADLNRKQLRKGKKSTGDEMPEYSRVSKDLFNKPEGGIQLFDTGDFHKSIEVDIGGEDYDFIASDIHDLEKRFGNNIYGLPNDSNYPEENVLPLIQSKFTELTGLEFN